MDHPTRLTRLLRLLLLLPLLVSLGCASVLWHTRKAFREPGERLTDFPEAVASEYDCENKKLPFFSIEKNELMPVRMRPGSEFAHRLVYVMCPDRPSAVITGTLETRIHFRGKPIVRDRIEAYDLKPGRWVVDAFIQLPEGAQEGVYSLELDFESRGVDFAKALTFVVEDR